MDVIDTRGLGAGQQGMSRGNRDGEAGAAALTRSLL